MKKRVLSAFLSICLLLAIIPGVALKAEADNYYGYNPHKAIQFAEEYVEKHEEWKCAEYVSRCMIAGGITFEEKYDLLDPPRLYGHTYFTGCWGLFHWLQASGDWKMYVLEVDSDMKVRWEDNEGKISKGDPVFVYNSAKDGTTDEYEHVYIANDTDSTYVTVYAHNRPADNEILKQRKTSLICWHYDPEPCDGEVGCLSRLFTDLNTEAWYHEGVDFAIKNGIMSGTGNRKFKPNDVMTRAMLVMAIWNYEGKPMEGENKFIDVPSDMWYTQAIAWAAHNGIVNGVSKDRFKPEEKITREQMATLLYRYAAYKGYDTAVNNGDRTKLDGFPDAANTSQWAKDGMAWAHKNGLVKGVGVGHDVILQPRGEATRAQLANILMRFIENIA